MQQLFDKDRWEVIFEKAFPVTRRFSCAEILEFCREDMEKLEMSRKRAGSPSLINM